MKRLATALICVFVLAGCGHLVRGGSADAPLEIAGVLAGHNNFRGYLLVSSDLLVPKGSTLTFEPGTTVLVRDSQSTKIDPECLSPLTEIIVRGTLIVNGEPQSPVRFIPERAFDVREPGWAGIILDRTTGSIVHNSEILAAETGVYIIDSSPEIIGNKISGSRYGIISQGGAAKILDNEIMHGEGGVFCWNDCRAYLKSNTIVDNDEEGIVVDSSSRPYIDRNIVSGNDIGLVVPAAIPYDPTVIKGNHRDVLLLKNPGGERR
ncbi:MAG: hypothetical protein C0623_12480 [Desulfuromonas sp.]|nr:MAG: hypothetical protein C0623_12480 [Desulfuromonas sp.]